MVFEVAQTLVFEVLGMQFEVEYDRDDYPYSYKVGVGRNTITSLRHCELKNGVSIQRCDSLNDFGLILNRLVRVYDFDLEAILRHIEYNEKMMKVLDDLKRDVIR